MIMMQKKYLNRIQIQSREKKEENCLNCSPFSVVILLKFYNNVFIKLYNFLFIKL